MNPTRSFIALTTASLIAACSTTMQTPPSGYISEPASLRTDAQTGNGFQRSAVAIDPGRIAVAAVEWRPTEADRLDPMEQGLLKQTLLQSLQKGVTTLPAATGGRPVVIRAAITRIETVSAPLNVLSTLLLLAPVDRGGAAVEIEAIDAETRKPLAAMRFGYFAPMSDLGARFSKLAPAEIALRRAGEEFVALLVPGASTGKATTPKFDAAQLSAVVP